MGETENYMKLGKKTNMSPLERIWVHPESNNETVYQDELNSQQRP
jgi:hypothetical protein